MHNINVERTMRRAVSVLVLLIACSLLAVNAQQGGTTRYVYDDAGRLLAVITTTGEAIIYQYDAAGNFTALLRETADMFYLIAFAPRSGSEGDHVTIVGTGFGPGVNSVSFNGLQAQILETTLSTIVVVVPVGASTGPITVNAVRGTATTSQSFIVRPKLDISPKNPKIFLGDTQQFTLTFSSQIPDHNVTWSVNGVVGGNSNNGTISATGLYTAPTDKSRIGNYTVRATSVSLPSMFIEAVVTVKDPDAIQEVRSSVSVLRPNGIVTSVGSYGAGVSVQYGFPAGSNAIIGTVSVTKGPHIASVAPLNVARGTSPTITITGANLTGASTLQFIREDGSLETGIVASNLSVSPDGSSMTATITINGGLATGSRVIFVTATAGQSTTHNIGLNVIGITP
jgi:YD repeat-containing protein